MPSVKAFALGVAVAALAGIFTASSTGAQTVADTNEVPSAASLNLPTEFTLFGKGDPHVRKATAIVNGEVITGTDIDQRLALIILANGGKVSNEERERLRLQVLRKNESPRCESPLRSESRRQVIPISRQSSVYAIPRR